MNYVAEISVSPVGMYKVRDCMAVAIAVVVVVVVVGVVAVAVVVVGNMIMFQFICSFVRIYFFDLSVCLPMCL